MCFKKKNFDAICIFYCKLKKKEIIAFPYFEIIFKDESRLSYKFFSYRISVDKSLFSIHFLVITLPSES